MKSQSNLGQHCPRSVIFAQQQTRPAGVHTSRPLQKASTEEGKTAAQSLTEITQLTVAVKCLAGAGQHTTTFTATTERQSLQCAIPMLP